MFDTVEQAQMRLSDTVVMFDGKPCVVQRLGTNRDDPTGNVGPQNITCNVIFLDGLTPSLEGVRLNDARWGFHDLRLGFVNSNRTAVWVSRLPRTTTRWGIDIRNLRSELLAEAGGQTQNVTRITASLLVPTLMNHYPTWTEVLHRLNNTRTSSIAFSRHFALLKDPWDMLFLYYKTVRIAYSEDGGETFRLTETYRYLREIIQQEAPNVRFNNAA